MTSTVAMPRRKELGKATNIKHDTTTPRKSAKMYTNIKTVKNSGQNVECE